MTTDKEHLEDAIPPFDEWRQLPPDEAARILAKHLHYDAEHEGFIAAILEHFREETTTMKDTPKLDDGVFDMDAEWECEHCKRKVRFGDTALSWCLNIICDDCHEKERDSENAEVSDGAAEK